MLPELTQESFLAEGGLNLSRFAQNGIWGQKNVTKFHQENREWIEEQKAANKRPPKELREAKHKKGLPSEGNRPAEPMSEEAKDQMRKKQLDGWGVTKIWRAIVSGDTTFEEVQRQADEGNILAKIAIRTMKELSSDAGEPMSVPLLKEFLARVDGPVVQVIDQTTRTETDYSKIPTELLEQMLPYLEPA